MSAESDAAENQESGQPPGGPRAFLKPWLLSLPPALVMLGVGWTWGGPPCGLFFAALAFLAVLAATHQPAGLLVLLSLAPFDQLINEQLRARCTWYPLPLHVMDPIAVGLLVGWGWAFLRGRRWTTFAWYDWVAGAFLVFLVLEAARGLVTGAPYTLRTGRFIPLLAAYFPARTILAEDRDWRAMAKWLTVWGIAFAASAVVLAYAFRVEYGRAGEDILLPRLCYVVDPRAFVLLVFVAWAALWERQDSRGRTFLLLGAIAALGALAAINNTRTFWLGIVAGWITLCVLLWKTGSTRQVWFRVAGLGLLCVVIGVTFVHTVQAAHPRVRFYLERMRQRRISAAAIKAVERRSEKRLAQTDRRAQQARAEVGEIEQQAARARAEGKAGLEQVERQAAPARARLEGKAAQARLAAAKRELEVLEKERRVATGEIAQARESAEVAKQVTSGAAPRVRITPTSVGSAMRIVPKTRLRAPQYSIPNRLRETKALLAGLSPVSLLVGHGVGAPITYAFIEWNGKEVKESFDFAHNSYLYFLHVSGLLGLGLCLAWVLGVLRHTTRDLVGIGNPHVPVLWVGSLLFACASLVMALAIGMFNWPSSAPLLASVLALLAAR